MNANLLDGWFKLDVGEGAFYALFGFLFVFCGIVLLVLFFTALGKGMKEVQKPRLRRKRKGEELPVPKQPIVSEEGVTPELVAVISAAIAAYYEDENVKCDFVVKRIKKL